MGDTLTLTRLLLVLLLFGVSLLSVAKAPIGFLWKPAIVATEWGHVLALVALALAFSGWTDAGGRLATVLSIGAMLLLLTPLIRAIPVARALPARLDAAFGVCELPRALPDAPHRRAPLVWTELLSAPSRSVTPTRHLYREVDGASLHLDLYCRNDAPTPMPVVVAIHGGSWASGDSTQLPAINHFLAARGYAVAAINYRLAPRHVFPAAYDDVLAAISYLEANAEELNIDARRLVLMGRSAGGQLALLAGYAANKEAIRGVIAYYPVSDMNWSWANPTNPLVLNVPRTLGDYLGGTPEDVPDSYDAASPYEFVTATSPPTLLIHGARDELVFARQSRRLQTRLDQAKRPHLYVEMPWATHGMDANLAGPGGQISTFAIERFLDCVLGDDDQI